MERKRSGGDLHMPSDTQTKPASSRATAMRRLFWVILRPAVSLRTRIRQTQLRLPGDISNDFGLALLADLQSHQGFRQPQSLAEPLDTFVGVLDRGAIFVERNLLSGAQPYPQGPAS